MKTVFRITLGTVILIIIFIFLIWFWATQPILLREKSLSDARVDPAKLEKHVRVLSETLSPRNYVNTGNLDEVAKYILTEFSKTKGNVSEQVFKVENGEYRNVILKLGPETNERIVIGAHYDAAFELPGADDNSSGVAGLIELAHLLNKTSPPMAIELIAYTLEEPPFFRTDNMGSAVHARSMKDQGVKIRIMISLEMIGYFSDEPDSQTFPIGVLKYIYPSTGNWIAVIGDISSGLDVRRVKKSMMEVIQLPVYSFNAPPNDFSGIDWSDHLNYWKYGYPAVMITDTSFLRNLNYHTERDTADLLDYERMSQVVTGVYGAILLIASANK